MSSFTTDLVIPKNLQDFCAMRVTVATFLCQAAKLLQDADEALETVYRYGLPREAKPSNSVEESLREIDQCLWDEAFDLTGFKQVMDSEALRDFRASLKKDTPEFNENNVRSIFFSAAADAENMFARGLVNVFLDLSKIHKTNSKSPFKVNRKAIMGYMVSNNYMGGLCLRCGRSSDQINDIDRVFKLLDNKKHLPRELESAINGAFKENNLFENEYYKIRGFRNGNLHIEFKREDLLDKANTVISQYYDGKALA